MEISRKKITDAEIRKAEQELAAAVDAITAEKTAEFAALGCELETEFSRDNDNLEGDEREAFRALGVTEECEYSFGYSSGVKITVKRKKTDEELAAEEAEAAGNAKDFSGLSEEEAELAQNEAVLEEAKRELSRNVAFTSMYFVHIYKAFWRESVSISDGTDEVRADLEEFLTVLREKAENGENE
ncbi:MAG: hypothetical protein IJW21_00925 [Clostridia bacterium]|nr:hypothetical protein [Clostridia bacterium]